jgi:hypothetical protein
VSKKRASRSRKQKKKKRGEEEEEEEATISKSNCLRSSLSLSLSLLSARISREPKKEKQAHRDSFRWILLQIFNLFHDGVHRRRR